MPNNSRRVPRGGKPAKRPVRGGGSVEGYVLNGSFVAFEPGSYDYTGSAAQDSSVSCSYESSSYGSDSSSSSSASDCGGY